MRLTLNDLENIYFKVNTIKRELKEMEGYTFSDGWIIISALSAYLHDIKEMRKLYYER